MVATLVVDELQIREFVRLCVLPSLYVPMAANCWVSPAGMEGLAGVTAIDTNVGVVTVSDAEPLIDPAVAAMVVVPALAATADPRLPASLLTLARAGCEELQ